MECEKVIPEDILVDLCSRFVINVPGQEQSDLIRICFQIELAHWFYIDFYSKNFPQKRPCGLKEFTLQVFKHIPFLQPFTQNIDEVLEEWKGYKFYVPTYGAIILDEDLSQVLLVQNYKSCWGFPKGKVNKDERPEQCAIREVYEETGFDITNLICGNDYLELNMNERLIRLYIVPGVSKNEKFIPQTRNEIKAVEWFPICDIPLSKRDAAFKQLKNGGGNTSNSMYSAFYMVSPFLRKLRQWIYEHSNNLPHRKKRQRHKSCSDIDQLNSLNLSQSVEMFKKFQNSNKFSPKVIDPVEIPQRLEPAINSEVRNSKARSKRSISNLSAVFGGNQQHPDMHLVHKRASSEQVISRSLVQKGASSEQVISRTLVQKEASSAQVSSRTLHFTDGSNKTFQSNVTVNPEIDLNPEKETMKSFLEKTSYGGGGLRYPNQDSWNTSGEASAMPLLSITSGDSAFRKVEKTSKVNRRKRKNKNAPKESGVLGSDTNDVASHRSYERKIVTCIPSLMNFEFDIGDIIQSMNEAILKCEN